MKTRPILFSTPMVQAILEGRKTQTRRVIKPQPIVGDNWFKWEGRRPKAKRATGAIFCTGPNMSPASDITSLPYSSPYGIPGDVLWVRERFLRNADFMTRNEYPFLYYTDVKPEHKNAKAWRWKPSIHMPKEAARIFLEITDVRVERLKDISRGDCMSEGCPFPNIAKETDPVSWFSRLWMSINGVESWHNDSWVWVIEFKRIGKPAGFGNV